MYEAAYVRERLAPGLNRNQALDISALKYFHQIIDLTIKDSLPVNYRHGLHIGHHLGHTKGVAPSAIAGVRDRFCSQIMHSDEAKDLLCACHEQRADAGSEQFVQRIIESLLGVNRSRDLPLKIVHDAHRRSVQPDIGWLLP